MIDWHKLTRDMNFPSEREMWKVLLSTLQSIPAISAYTSISESSVRQRLHLLGLKTMKTYPKELKKGKLRARRVIHELQDLPKEIWYNKTVTQIAGYIGCSAGYVSRTRSRLVKEGKLKQGQLKQSHGIGQ